MIRYCKNHPDRQERCIGLCNACYSKDVYWRSATKRREKSIQQKKYKKALSPYRRWKKFLRDVWKKTPNWYRKVFRAQNGLCALCRKPPKKHRRLSIDHDHSTGIIRGLLCARCNLILAQFFENQIMYTRVLEYLKCSAPS